MKDAKEYWNEVSLPFHVLDIVKSKILEAIKQAQTDAWNEALDKAAESAEIDWTENDVFQYSDSDFSFRDNDGNWCKINISENSILKLKI